jgi:hypothetical protein
MNKFLSLSSKSRINNGKRQERHQEAANYGHAAVQRHPKKRGPFVGWAP